MASWRLTVRDIDRSSTVRGVAGGVGAMILRASKGPVKPIKISRGDENRILDLFGTPSASYPDVWEAIQFNYQDDIWLSAPYSSDALLGGVLITDSGSIALSESEGIDPATYANYSFNSDNEYMLIVARSPYTDDLGVKVTYNSTSGFFKIELYKTTDDGATWVLKKTFESVSLTADTKDGFGKNVYAEVLMDEDDDYLLAVVNSNADITNGFVDDTSVIALNGGIRGATPTITQWTTGWNYFQSVNTYPADIFMDVTADDGIPTIFNTLRNTYQKYATYIIPLPGSEAAATSITTKTGYSINNKGIDFFVNRGRVKDIYNNSSFWTSMIGRIGVKFAQMTNIFNGGAPAWIDENSHGGQLGPGIIELEYDYTESQLEAFDEAGINPVIFHPYYGVMIASQRTGQSPNTLSDTSWIAHARLFDYIKTNIITQVLTYQIVKINDELHRQLAIAKGNTLMDPILASNLLAEYVIQCDTNNNDDAALAQRQFVYTVGVKVTPYSELIIFEFVNVAQTVSVSEVIG